jgi:hypothetical protein
VVDERSRSAIRRRLNGVDCTGSHISMICPEPHFSIACPYPSRYRLTSAGVQPCRSSEDRTPWLRGLISTKPLTRSGALAAVSDTAPQVPSMPTSVARDIPTAFMTAMTSSACCSTVAA